MINLKKTGFGKDDFKPKVGMELNQPLVEEMIMDAVIHTMLTVAEQAQLDPSGLDESKADDREYMIVTLEKMLRDVGVTIDLDDIVIRDGKPIVTVYIKQEAGVLDLTEAIIKEEE